MEKAQFLSLIKNYTSLENEDLEALMAVQKEYPYSQAINNLASRVASDTNSFLKEDLLHLSAIYTTERSVLKSIMTEPRGARIEIKAPRHVEPERAVVAPPIADRVIIEPSPAYATPHDNGLLIDNIFKDLESLRKSKLLYEASMEVLEKENQVINSLKLNDPELEKPSNAIDEDVIADEIIKNISEIPAVDPKHKEQIEIIENFIKAQPALNRSKSETVEQPADLTENTQQFADNVVSETLVEILVKQGKKAKAIEVLKKLIWKFPQKKAYFAAQIEDLKK